MSNTKMTKDGNIKEKLTYLDIFTTSNEMLTQKVQKVLSTLDMGPSSSASMTGSAA